MAIHSVTHIALRVQDVRAAEAFYCELFDLTVAWREAETADGWRTLPEGKSWDDALTAGIDLQLVMLHNDGFALALEAVQAVQAQGTLSHLGLHVDQSTFDVLQRRAPLLGCSMVTVQHRTIVFDDPFGVRWEPTLTTFADPRQLSSGARYGHWLQV
ncbi:VOC family protein [Candidatus Gracilibacteria bacterium]|nr:VOC family protein [Candidatus Gracilibacteria bacterium]